MKKIPYSRYQKLVLVCTNERDNNTCCKKRGSDELHRKLKEAMSGGAGSGSAGKKQNKFVRVVATRCLGHCIDGTTIAIMPDNIWFGDVSEEDIPSIIEYCTNTKQTE